MSDLEWEEAMRQIHVRVGMDIPDYLQPSGGTDE